MDKVKLQEIAGALFADVIFNSRKDVLEVLKNNGLEQSGVDVELEYVYLLVSEVDSKASEFLPEDERNYLSDYFAVQTFDFFSNPHIDDDTIYKTYNMRALEYGLPHSITGGYIVDKNFNQFGICAEKIVEIIESGIFAEKISNKKNREKIFNELHDKFEDRIVNHISWEEIFQGK